MESRLSPLATELDLDQPFEDIRHEAILSIVHTANLVALTGAKLFRKYGLTEAQFNVLFALRYKLRELTQSDLGKRLVVTRATITSTLDKLEAKGLVERRTVENNRRIYHVELTPAGRALLDAVEPQYRDSIQKATAGLSMAQIREILRLLEPLRQGLRGVGAAYEEDAGADDGA